MSLRSRTLSLLLLLVCAPPVAAQQWTADVYAGGTRYDARASFAAATHLVGNIRYESARLVGFISAAASLDTEGTGLTTYVIPLISLAYDDTEFQLRAGRRDHHADAPAGASSRHMYEAGIAPPVLRDGSTIVRPPRDADDRGGHVAAIVVS